MGVPKKHKTPGSRNQRRAHIRVVKKSFASCQNCGREVFPHMVCMACGYYRGKKAIDIVTKKKK